MRIRLTVARAGAECGEAAVVVTAPVGTVLAAVTSALVTESAAAGGGAEGAAGDGPAPVFAGTQRLDPHRHVLGEPPLLDGAAVSLYGPGRVPPTAVSTASAVAAYGTAKARLHVVAGPDAGGVHLLQGGQVHLGRSAEADVPLDDPDVSRLHCAVTVTDSGDVTVTDLGSTNGTTLDGRPVGERPLLLRPGATLRLGESEVRLVAAEDASAGPAVPAPVPDGKGRLRLAPPAGPADAARPPAAASWPAATTAGTGSVASARSGAPQPPADPRVPGPGSPAPQGQQTPSAAGSPPVDVPAPPPTTAPQPPLDVPHARTASGSPAPGGTPPPGAPPRPAGTAEPEGPGTPFPAAGAQAGPGNGITHGAGVAPARADQERSRSKGLGAWARRFAGGRAGTPREAGETQPGGTPGTSADGTPAAHRVPAQRDRRALPDPAAVLLTALGPGPQLWEREPSHPDALTVRLGTAHQGEGSGEPVTVSLREAGSLGLAGPRSRLAGLARSVVAQLAALHGPATLEIVLLSADRARDVETRTAEWSWLGWLPHLVPAHGQDCRLLTAYDRDQAAARTAELTRRLEVPGAAGQRPHPGPYTLLIVDGDPGSASLRDTVARLTAEGPVAGIHTLCLAETPAASPASPLTATLEAAHAVSPAFSACGSIALLSGAVATAVRMVLAPGSSPGGGQVAGNPGPIATVDAVSAAWAERFARALAPLREAEDTRARAAARPAVPLPRSSRLLDELGLARATPAALLARWSEPDSAGAGHAALVLGAGPHGPLEAGLSAEHGHALITGPVGAGRTELLLSCAASLAAGDRPGRLGLLLLDGVSDPARDGLLQCAGLPHTDGHLTAGDPGRMREFAQSLSAELKQRAELIGEQGTFEEYARAAAEPHPGRVVAQRSRTPEGAADLESDSSGGTLRLRTRSGSGGEDGEPQRPRLPRLARLVVLVDDFDTLVDPALGNPGRPASGSVVRALDAVARDGARLGVHLVAASARADSTAGTELARAAALRIELDGTAAAGGDGAPESPSGADDEGGEEPVAGRGTLRVAGAAPVSFQAGRVTGRIPRTATLRPTVVPLDWARAGDPPTRRPVRELGNGPTDLALLASAIERAAQSLGPAGASRSRTGEEGPLDS